MAITTPFPAHDPCPAWCVVDHRDDDPLDLAAGDLAHLSTPRHVPIVLNLTEHGWTDAAHAAGVVAGPSGVRSAEFAVVARCYPRQPDVWVYVGNEERFGLDISAESARRLHAALGQLLSDIG